MIKRLAGFALLAGACFSSAVFAAEAAATAAPAPAAAAQSGAAAVPLADNHPTTYTVQPGDTLWGISQKFLQNPWQWPEVWHINEQVGNPHLIFPGDVLRLVWKDGKPSLVVDGGTAGIGSADSVVEVVDAQTVKLRPRIREQPVSAAIPAIPLKNIEAFLNDSRVVEQDELKKAPYIMAGADKRIVMGRGDTVYARAAKGTPWSDAFPEYGIYRGTTKYVDPDSGEVLGFEARRVGSSRVVAIDGEVATMRVLESSEDLRIDDRLLYNDQRKVQSIFYPTPSPDGVEGKIIHLFDTLAYAARNQVVVINKGLRDKVNPGQVFAIMQKGERVRDRNAGDSIQLPPTRAGMLIVFRAFDKVSYGLITSSSRPIGKGDMVRQPRIDIE